MNSVQRIALTRALDLLAKRGKGRLCQTFDRAKRFAEMACTINISEGGEYGANDMSLRECVPQENTKAEVDRAVRSILSVLDKAETAST